MSNSVFPSLPGLKFQIKKTPIFNNIIHRSASLREARAALAIYPLYRWELSYEMLRDRNATDDLKTLMGFYLSRQGSFDDFLFDDSTDQLASNQVLGIGNNSGKNFQMARTLGGWTDVLTDINTANNTPAVYLNGVLQNANNYTIYGGNNGTLSFNAAPGNNVTVSASFRYYWRVRFEDLGDSDAFEYFMYQLWQLRTLAFVSAR